MLVGVLFPQTFSTLPLSLARDYGLREDAIGLLLAINPVLIVVLEMVLLRLLGPLPILPVIAGGSFLIGAGLGMLGFGHTPHVGGVFDHRFSFGEMLAFPLAEAWVANRASDSNIGTYLGHLLDGLQHLAGGVADHRAHRLRTFRRQAALDLHRNRRRAGSRHLPAPRPPRTRDPPGARLRPRTSPPAPSPQTERGKIFCGGGFAPPSPSGKSPFRSRGREPEGRSPSELGHPLSLPRERGAGGEGPLPEKPPKKKNPP